MLEDESISLWVAAAGTILFVLIAARLGKRGATNESSSAETAARTHSGEPESDDEDLDDLTSDDPDQAESSLPAAQAVTPTIPAPISDFIGRDLPARALHELLENRKSALIVPQGGRKGLGATELALSVAADLEHVYPDGRIALDLDPPPHGPLTPEQAMSRVLQAIEPQRTPAPNSEQLSERYSEILASKQILIVADNARDPRQLEALPPPEPAALLATASRAFDAPGVESVPLGPLEPAEAESLLGLPGPAAGSSREAVQELLEVCRGDPLLLSLAGGQLLASKSSSVEAYVERLEKGAGSEQDKNSIAPDAAEQLAIRSPARAARWSRLSVFPAAFDRIAGEIVAQLEKGDFEDLVARNLLRYDPVEERACLHELLFEPARSVGVADELAVVEQRHAEYYLRIALDAERLLTAGGDGVTEALRCFDRDRPHIETGQDWAARHTESDDNAATMACDYALRTGSILERRLSPRERAPWFEAAVKAAQRLDDRKSQRIAAERLGQARAAMGDVKAAIRSYHQALSVARDSGNRRSEARVLFEEALAFEQLGTLDHALSRAAQALIILEEIGDPKTEQARRKVEEWKSGRVEEWKSGRVEEWKSGRVEEPTPPLMKDRSATGRPQSAAAKSRNQNRFSIGSATSPSISARG